MLEMSPPAKLKTYARSLQFTSIASATIYGISAIQKLPTPLMCWISQGFQLPDMPGTFKLSRA